MKSGLTVRADKAAAVLESLKKLSGMDVLVGIPAENATREDGEALNNAEIGYLQSTGATVELGGKTTTLHPRPFLDIGIEDTKDRTTLCLKAAAERALEGKQDAAIRELERAGQIAREGAKKVISDGDRLHPLSEKTLQNRRDRGIPGDKPLYDHGYLLRSINYVVRNKNATS
ncbi:hypothetical protein GPY51_21425 [Photorhabdus laumondii subsp. laumondii]|uniref:Bacteriophage protein n=1 Tax=Photorhabdus laumondii subsp. laumondii TaxID=141679 RepID=A0A6L9JPN4_PHOLM|nr:hypothetical protein [Photorhabdus laumondii]MCC8384964.1 hypothetical protein [Photorhabdus laumondii]MCC8413670.1 hypothetical protein [Photorhabdus laumondii]NDK96832.1 hypothetical protein [Photorhabdus laumondii subsp. laumondii]NDL23028.1 hypothetical protein [Photorhabdus laumondii subsp. laumondii]NDL32027.1 hypothetical protein [Photorhabdus laumondii subsp. laumondii]